MFGLGINRLGSNGTQAIAEPETLLFAGDENGTFLDFTTTQVYADTAGTDPAEVGEGIAFVDDKSPNDTDSTQATSTARPIFRLTSSVYNAEFDLTDDVLPITLPAITGGTVALVGLNGIWIEDNWDYAGGTLNIGPTTIAGLPAGILDVVGDLCAVIINDRAWTAAELAGVIAWGKARGAPGVFGLGPELVTNGTFDTDLTGWSTTNPGSSTTIVSSGVAYLQGSSSEFPSIFQGIGSTGETCLVALDKITAATPASNDLEVRYGNTIIGFGLLGGGRHSFVTTSDGGSLVIIKRGTTTTAVGFDNVSVRKLELLP